MMFNSLTITYFKMNVDQACKLDKGEAGLQGTNNFSVR